MAQPAPRDRRPEPNGHRRLLTKILTGLTSFWVAFGLSSLVPEDQKPELVWSIAASLFVAGVAFIAHYLYDVEKRLDTLQRSFDDNLRMLAEQLRQRADATDREIQDGFSKIHLAEEIFGLREASQLNAEEMLQIANLARNRTKITSRSSQLIQDFALAEMTRLVKYLRQMADDIDLTYEGEDRDWLLGLTKVTRNEIQATSLTTVDAGGQGFIDGVWSTDFGQRYLDFQRHAMQARGVRVQRLFIIDRKGLDLGDLHQTLRTHVGIGVEVRVLNATVASALHTRLTDFIIFDRRLSYETTTTNNIDRHLIPHVVNITLVTDPDRVGRRISEFAELWTAEGVQVVTLDERNKSLVFRPATSVDRRAAPEAEPADIPPALPAAPDGTASAEVPRQPGPDDVVGR